MNSLSQNTIYKLLNFTVFSLALYILFISFYNNSSSVILNEDVLDISFENQIIDKKFIALFEDSQNIESSNQKEILFM